MKLGSKEIQPLYYGSKGVVKAMFGSKLIWEKEKIYPDDPNANYFTLVNWGYNMSSRYKFTNDIQYSYDKETWHTLPANTWSEDLDYEDKHLVYLKGQFKPQREKGIGTFSIEGSIGLLGNIMSLLFGGQCDKHRDLTGYDYAFYKLFYNSNAVVDTQVLNGIDIFSPYSFAYAFAGCSLYYWVVIDRPITLSPYCFYNAFANNNVSEYAGGDSYDPIILPDAPFAPHCYDSMFANTRNLHAITIPQHSLAEGCLNNTFAGSSDLALITYLSLDAPNEQCCLNWVDGVADSGAFVKTGDAEWEDEFGVSAIPEGWEIIFYSDDLSYILKINTILESIIAGEELDDMVELLEYIDNSGKDFTDINNQLEEIIDRESVNETPNSTIFYIKNIKYQAEEGMTLGEWCDSPYNIDGWKVGSSLYVYNDKLGLSIESDNANSIITNGCNFYATIN